MTIMLIIFLSRIYNPNFKMLMYQQQKAMLKIIQILTIFDNSLKK